MSLQTSFPALFYGEEACRGAGGGGAKGWAAGALKIQTADQTQGPSAGISNLRTS